MIGIAATVSLGKNQNKHYFPPPHQVPWWWRQILLVQTILFIAHEDAYVLLRMKQRCKMNLLQKGISGKGSSSSYLISVENFRFLCYVTSCHGPLSEVSWSFSLGQESDLEQTQTPTVCNYDNCWCSLMWWLCQSSFFCLVTQIYLPHNSLILWFR